MTRPPSRPAARGDRVPAIHQVVPTLAPDDATGNLAFALQRVFRGWGYASEIFGRKVHPEVAAGARAVKDLADDPGAVVVLHYGLYAEDAARVVSGRGCKVLYYHNITPAPFFRDWDLRAWLETTLGRDQLPGLVRAVDLALADSAFNRAELEALGARHARTQPLLLDLDALARTPPCPAVLTRWGDGAVNLLFVGRLVPNKRQDELLRAFARYRRAWNPFARLLLVGSPGVPAWADALRALADALGVGRHVVFAGRVTREELAAFYRVAHVFVCLSDHEGFCIPLVEAMRFDLPVIARAATAVPDTLDGAGILLSPRDGAPVVAAAVARVLADEPLRAAVLERQRRRLEALSPARATAALAANLGEVLA